jgi:hypothetical protein
MKFHFLLLWIFCTLFWALRYNNASAQAQFNAFGSATNMGNNCFQLTPDAQWQAGTIWNTTQLNLNCPFDYTYNVYLGNKDANGADGIAFVLQQNGPNVIGTFGGCIGYGNISPSLAIEIDTHNNGPGAGDIPCDHIAIYKNGVCPGPAHLGPVQASSSNCNIEDGQYHSFRVVWNPQTFTLQVYFDGVLRLTLNENIIQTFFNNNPNVWWGFTAGTGSLSNQQNVCPTFLQTENVCVNTPVTVHYTGVTPTNPVYNWNWSGANVTPGTGPGPHTVSWNTPGNKTVSLTITNAICSYSAMNKIYNVLPGPTASIGVNPSSACPNQAVQVSFTGQASAGATYTWNFGAGATPATAAGQGPHSVMWNSSGTKTITLTVTNPGTPACAAQATQTVNILTNCQTITSCPNVYAKVTAIDLCTNSLTVSSSAGFNVGDKVLLIQMKGATIDQTNTANYGNITAYNSAGNYEFQTISAIAGNVITLQHQLVRTYDVNHFVQLVKVGTYNNLVTQGTITCPAWNAATGTGGVMAIEASGQVALGGNIHMNGAGFRGGFTNWNEVGNHPCGLTAFFLPNNTPDAGEKGEGIAHWVAGQENARGKLANGGGGGNSHNHGGGGGGNMGVGGVGGYWSGCAPNIGGLGGANLLYNNVQNKIFLGGGGGGGHQNNSVGANGGRGGGLIILKAGSLIGNNNAIQANGQDGFNTPGGGWDGAGGGGAGGTILLDVPVFTTNLNVNVNGGKGGNACCFVGPGGGGAGGIVWSAAALPGNVNATFTGGANGIEWGGNPMLATPGNPGGTLTGLNMPQGTVPFIQQAVTIATTTPSVCQGTSATLTSNYTNCTGCSGVSYQWQLNATDIAGATSSTYTTPTNLAPGSYTYRLRVTTSTPQCTVFSPNLVITVLALPTPTFTAQNVCASSAINNTLSTVTYTGNAQPGATFTWNCGGCSGGNPTTQGPHNLSWATAGVKTLTLVVQNNSVPPCISTVHTVLITVNPAPTSGISLNDNTICTNTSTVNASTVLNFLGTAQPGATYNWNCDGCVGGNPTTAGPHTLSWSSAGNKTISLSVTNPGNPACSSPTSTATILVNPTPTSDFSASSILLCTQTAVNDNTISLVHTGTGFPTSTYYWNCGGCVWGGGSGPGPHTVSWQTPGVKTLSLTVANLGPPVCSAPPFSLTVTVNPTPTNTFTATNACTNSSTVSNTSTVTFTGSSFASVFTWNCDGCVGGSPTTAGPHTLSWSTSGTKTITLQVAGNTAPACQSGVQSVLVTIHPTPTSNFGAQNVCQNSSPNNFLSNVSYQGTAPPNSIFTWNCDGCVAGNPTGSGPFTLSWQTVGIKTLTLQVESQPQGCLSEVTSVTITVHPVPAPPSVNAISRCGRGSVTLTATVGVNGDNLRWYSSLTTSTPLITALSYTTPELLTVTTYYVSSYNSATGCESSREPIVVNIMPIPGIPMAANVSRCGPGPVTFSVTTGQPSGDQVKLFASPFSTQPVGNPSVSLVPPFQLGDSISTTTTYYISSFKTYPVFPSITCESQRIPVVATMHPLPAIPISTHEKRCGPGPITFLLDMGHPAGNEAYLYDVPVGGVPLAVTNSNSNPPNYQLTTPLLPAAPPYFPYSYRDTFYVEAKNNVTGCVSPGRNMYIATVNVVPHPPTVSDMKRCGSGVLTFTLTQIVPGNAVAGNSIRIYASQQGGVAITTIQSPPYLFTTPVLTSTTTFYAESIIDSTQCPSPRMPFVAEVIPYLNPATSGDVSRCGGGQVTFTVQTGYSQPGLVQARLYDLPLGGSVIATDDTPPYELTSPSVATTTTFYVETYIPSVPCSSGVRIPVRAVVLPVPDTAIVPSVSRCGAGSVTFYPKLSSPNGDVMRLYTVPVGGVMVEMDNLQGNPPFRLEVQNVTTTSAFYVEVYNSVTGCASLGRRAVTATIYPVPSVPLASDTFRCGSGSATVVALPGDSLASGVGLYDAMSGGNLLQQVTALPYAFSLGWVTTHSTYYAESYNSVTGCRSGRVPVRVEVRPVIGQPVISDITRCGGGDVRAFAAMGVPGGGGIEIYESAVGGSLVAASYSAPYSFVLPNVTLTTTFYAAAVDGSNPCTSARRPFVVTILPVPSAPEALPLSRCGSGGGNDNGFDGGCWG